jgi:hypothetical protein
MVEEWEEAERRETQEDRYLGSKRACGPGMAIPNLSKVDT